MANYPKFEGKLHEQLINPNNLQNSQPGYGIILAYDSTDNTATVLMAQPGSDQIGEFYTKVPCPTNIGVQGVAPEQGRQCWVVFKDGTLSNPMITHFFNHAYKEIDQRKHNEVINELPRFMMEL